MTPHCLGEVWKITCAIGNWACEQCSPSGSWHFSALTLQELKDSNDAMTMTNNWQYKIIYSILIYIYYINTVSSTGYWYCSLCSIRNSRTLWFVAFLGNVLFVINCLLARVKHHILGRSFLDRSSMWMCFNKHLQHTKACTWNIFNA